MTSVDSAVTIEDLRRLALRRLPRFIGDYLEGGNGDSGGIRRNIDAFRDYHFIPRGLNDVLPVDTGNDVFGKRYAAPVGISAVGLAGIYRRHADELLAETAREANVPFILSGASMASIETVSKIAPGHVWYQLYGAHTPEVTADMLRRAHDAGVEVLVYTVDYPLPPRSQVTARTGVSMATGVTLKKLPKLFLDALLHPAWTYEYLRNGGLARIDSWAPYAPPGVNARQLAKYHIERWNIRAQTWHDLDTIRALWKGKLVVKGLVHPDDVKRAVAAGADAVTVSNHGGNKLDCMQASLTSLAQVRAAVGPDVRLFLDGGIRRGSDLLVAKALGAEHCFVGRATLYGVTAGGVRGARRAIDILQSDLAYTMAMIGTKTLADVTRDCLAMPGH